MSLDSNKKIDSVAKEVPVSKVTFSPISTDALVVSIRTVASKPGEVRGMELARRSESLDSKRPRVSRNSSGKFVNKSTMTEYRKEISIASQTSIGPPSFDTSQPGHRMSHETTCLKHAAENISIKASDMPSEKVSLCNNCSKSMLSYIFLVQDFLDSLAKEICDDANAQDCRQCMRERVRHQISSRDPSMSIVQSGQVHADSRSIEKSNQSQKSDSLNSSDSTSGARKKSSRTKDKQKDSKTKDSFPNSKSSNLTHDVQNSFRAQQTQHQRESSQLPTYSSSSTSKQHSYDGKIISTIQHQDQNDPISNPQSTAISHQQSSVSSSSQGSLGRSSQQEHDVSSDNQTSGNPFSEQHASFIKPMERQQPNFVDNASSRNRNEVASNARFQSSESVSSPSFGEGVGRIMSTLSNAEREVYDSARNGAGWEGMTEAQERLVDADGRILSEAFVTMCRNNAEALGCLVVGTSLLLTQTTRTLCVLISDGVSLAFREPLSLLFHVVQTVRSLDSLGTTKLALLEQPELGISFDKLNIWRLTQFHKCVYLNPDTLVVQNCDELFNREELSAVPDIGWPDCFNSGVFVFSPSVYTFWQLLEFSDKQGSYDGGDQGLLNSYFSSWSSDINKKLSFIYNLMANVSYTYTPAFKQFGRDVKIVQFHGTFKPWHVKYFSGTGLISPSSAVHPNYVQFVNQWIKMFRGSALRQLSPEIQSYTASQEVVCAVELLRFFPLPSESEAEFFLTPPSVRLRLAQMKLHRIPRHVEEARRRKSAEYLRSDQQVDDDLVEDSVDLVVPEILVEGTEEAQSPDTSNQRPADPEESEGGAADVNVVEEEGKLPGSEVGNYQGMKKWEQGKMDYQGRDSSDSVIKRLEFLMSQSK